MEDQKTIRYEFGEKNKNLIDRNKLSLKNNSNIMRDNNRNKNTRGRTASRELNKKCQIDSRNDPSLESSSPQSYIGNMIDLTASSGSSSSATEQMVGPRRSDVVNDDHNVIAEKYNREKGTASTKSALTTSSSSLWSRVARSRRSSRMPVAKEEINKLRNANRSNKIHNDREIREKEQIITGKENVLPKKKQITYYQNPEELLSEAKSTLENWPFSSLSSSSNTTGQSLSMQQKRSQYYGRSTSNNNNNDNNANLKEENKMNKTTKIEQGEHDYFDDNRINAKGDNHFISAFTKNNEDNTASLMNKINNNNVIVEEQIKQEKDKQITQEITVNNMLTFGQNYFNNALRGNCVDIMNNDNNKAATTPAASSSSSLEVAHNNINKSNYTTLSSSSYASPSTTTATNNASAINHHRSPFFVPIILSASSDLASNATTNTNTIKHHHDHHQHQNQNLEEEFRQHPSSINSTNQVPISTSQQYPQVFPSFSSIGNINNHHDYSFADSEYSSPIARMRDSRTHKNNNNRTEGSSHNTSVFHATSSSPSDTTTTNTSIRRSAEEHNLESTPSSFSDIILNTITGYKEQRQQQQQQQNSNETQHHLSKSCNETLTSCTITPLGQKVIQLRSKHKFNNCGTLDDVDAAVDNNATKIIDDNTTIHSSLVHDYDESIANDADDDESITMTSLFPPKYYSTRQHNHRQSPFSDVVSSSVQTYDDDDDDDYTNHTNFASQCSKTTTTTNVTNQNTTTNATTNDNNTSKPYNDHNLFQFMADSIQKFSQSSQFLSLIDQYSCTTIPATTSNDTPIANNDGQHDDDDGDNDDYDNTSESIVASSESIAASSFSKQSFRKVLSTNITNNNNNNNNNDDTRSIFSSDLSSVFRTIDLLPEEPQDSTLSNTSISKKKSKKNKIYNFTPQTFLTELTKGIPLKLHGISSSPSYVQPFDIILTISLSKFKRGEFNEPKLIWKLVNTNNNEHQQHHHNTNITSNNNKSIHNNNSSSSNSSSSLIQGSLDIFDITSIESSNTSSLNLYPFAIPTCSFILCYKKKTSPSSSSSITTYDNNIDPHDNSSILFEATSKDEQRRVIHALQNLIPWFTYNLISGNKENCWDLFDSSGALSSSFMKDDDFSNLSIEELGDLCAAKGLNDVTNHLVEKTTVQMKRKEKKKWSGGGGGSVATTVNINANTIASFSTKK